MKLRVKIFITFAVALILCILTAIFGLTYVLDSLSTKMMKKQAENLTGLLLHRIDKSLSTSDLSSSGSLIHDDFLIAKHVADESNGFRLKKILLIDRNLDVRVGYPEAEIGNSYAEHGDIREAFATKRSDTVVETYPGTDGSAYKDIDVVAYLDAGDDGPLVLEVKLDFAESIVLLEKQYTAIESGAIAISLFLLTALLGSLLIMMGRTVIRPVLRVTGAMESVGRGDLDIHLEENANDEFGLLARRFNEMVTGLKEKFHLYRYVSQSTIDAVRESLDDQEGHKPRKTTATLFFSDIRGFTTYSETRTPETVFENLNKVLSVQSEIIRKYNGDVDKFVGDEVMALFPSADEAVSAAVEIQREIEDHNEEFDGLHIGIGIHAGAVIQGDVGSAQMRDFTVIGDNVNIAARLESLAGKGEVLISREIALSEDIRNKYRLKSKGSLKLKGRDTLISTYIIAGLRD